MPQLGASGARPALPITALLIGALCFFGAGVALAVWPATLLAPLNAPSIVALVHVITIGFISVTFAGTLQQLPPVMMVTHLRWPRLGSLSLPLLFAGAATLITGFALDFTPVLLIAGGCAVVLAWLLLVAQLVATALTKWPRDAASQSLILGMVFLFITVSLGLLLAHIRVDPYAMVQFGYPRTLHFTVGLFGAFLLGIVGAGQKLLAMFALSKGTQEWRVRLAMAFITIGIIFEAISAFSGTYYGWWPMIFLAAGALFHLLEVRAVLRVRLRKVLEAPVYRFVLAHAFLILSGVLLVLGDGIAATIAFLVGFVGIVISGMAVKIVSFLIWTAVFTGKQGGLSGRAPLLRDLVLPWLEPLITWPLVGGTVLLIIGLMTRVTLIVSLGGVGIAIGAGAFVLQLMHVVVTTVRAGNALEAEGKS